LLEGLSGGFTSKVGRGLPPASRGQDIALVSWEQKQEGINRGDRKVQILDPHFGFLYQ
jgi:hypothetical protein